MTCHHNPKPQATAPGPNEDSAAMPDRPAGSALLVPACCVAGTAVMHISNGATGPGIPPPCLQATTVSTGLSVATAQLTWHDCAITEAMTLLLRP